MAKANAKGWDEFRVVASPNGMSSTEIDEPISPKLVTQFTTNPKMDEPECLPIQGEEMEAQRLKTAELMLKFAFCSSAKVHLGSIPLLFTWGKFKVTREQLELSLNEKKFASVGIEHCCTYILALEVDQIMEKLYGPSEKRCDHEDTEVRNISSIVKLIRNAFAHNPFSPE